MVQTTEIPGVHQLQPFDWSAENGLPHKNDPLGPRQDWFSELMTRRASLPHENQGEGGGARRGSMDPLSAPKGIFLPGSRASADIWSDFVSQKSPVGPYQTPNPPQLAPVGTSLLPPPLPPSRMIAFWNHFPVCNTSYSLPNLVSSSSRYRERGACSWSEKEDWKIIVENCTLWRNIGWLIFTMEKDNLL